MAHDWTFEDIFTVQTYFYHNNTISTVPFVHYVILLVQELIIFSLFYLINTGHLTKTCLQLIYCEGSLHHCC